MDDEPYHFGGGDVPHDDGDKPDMATDSLWWGAEEEADSDLNVDEYLNF